MESKESRAEKSVTYASESDKKETELKYEPDGSSKFDRLLMMLQWEHEQELAALRSALAGQVALTEAQLLEVQANLRHVESEVMERFSTYVEPPTTDNPVTDERAKEGVDSGNNEPASPRDKNRLQRSLTFMTEHDRQVDKENELAMIRGWALQNTMYSSYRFERTKEYPEWRKKLMRIVTSTHFEALCAAAIISNAVMMGAQIDFIARHQMNPLEGPKFYSDVDMCYTVWFIVEVILKITVFGRLFFCGKDWTWNTFDLFVVTTDAIQGVLESSSSLSNLTALRMMRVLRVTRALRVVRLIRFFRELRIMVYSVIRCGTSLIWTMLTFGLIIYVFSIFLLNAVALFVFDHVDDKHHSNYRHYWSSLPSGMWTLFSCMTGGVSWMEVGDPLLYIGWVYGGVLGFFMFFTIFVVTNIVTGIFVDATIQSAASDRNEVIQEQLHERDSARLQLKEVFEDADADRSGTLTVEEFEAHIKNESVRAHLWSIGLHVDEARGLFRLLDMDQRGELEIEEFLLGCMRLKGEATSIDLAMLMYENKRLYTATKKLHSDVEARLSLLFGMLAKSDPAFEPRALSSTECGI